MNNQSLETSLPLPEVSEASMKPGFLETIQTRLNTQEPWAVDLIIFGLAGFVAGFLLKNFGKFFFLTIAVLFGLIMVAHYTHIYDMPFERLQEFLGIHDVQTLQQMIKVKIEFLQNHPVAAVSGLCGLLVGWKVG